MALSGCSGAQPMRTKRAFVLAVSFFLVTAPLKKKKTETAIFLYNARAYENYERQAVKETLF